jgi:hypothetical protein
MHERTGELDQMTAALQRALGGRVSVPGGESA